MAKRYLNSNVYDEAIQRIVDMYEQGHRVVVSFSAGKDSGVCLELTIIAAERTGNLPVEVVIRDEEIMFPGTYEYAERVASRKEVDMHWMYANQPIVNAFNRREPYFWVFDPLLDPEDWMRQPPEYAYQIPDMNIQRMVSMDRFTPTPGKYVCNIIGIRVQESLNRRMALYSSRGYFTKPDMGVFKCRPIYDWKEADVWKAIHDNQWDYNHAYDVMFRMGLKRSLMRIAPPTLSPASVDSLGMAQRAWPQWFDKLAKRLPGVRTAAQYGRRAVEPQRRYKETWQECYKRVCMTDAPQWIRDRSRKAVELSLRLHAKHSTTPFPDVNPCTRCSNAKSWRELTKIMYMGDPFSLKMRNMPYVEPEFFRPGAGKWLGTPTF